MIDGIINETKDSRLLKADLPATYEEFKALIEGEGLPADILMREAGWRQLPTYLNKKNLMEDATEEAIWENAANRTVNDALRMLSDVAYGRVATLTVTVQETDGTPIPDVTVRLDSAPTVGTDPVTGTDGTLKLDTSGGSHTVYLAYPVGYSVESANQTVQVAGNASVTVKNVTRSTDSVFKITASKAFYVARYLSPVQFHIHGGGGSGGLHLAAVLASSGDGHMQGGAGGYYTVTDAVDVSGKLIRAYLGAGGARVTAARPTGTKNVSQAGNRGGTTTLVVGSDTYTAQGGAGGSAESGINADGGAAGGAGTGYGASRNGSAGPNLFSDSSMDAVGGGGGGANIAFDGESSFVFERGNGGAGGGTNAVTYDYVANSDIYQCSADASDGGGSGALVLCSNLSSNWTGKGGDGFVAFRKAVS